MADNQFTGTLFPDIGGCTALQMLDLHGNRLIGNLPRTLGFLKNIHVLDL